MRNVRSQESNLLAANEQPALPVNLADALQASIICHALTMSFRSGQPVYFDENGDIIPPIDTNEALRSEAMMYSP